MVLARQILFLLLFLLSVLFSCSKSTKHEKYQLPPGAHREASVIALYLSGELEASESLTNKVLRELAAIRSAFGNDFPITCLEFLPPWVVACVIVAFDDTTHEKVVAGNYHAWDQLNDWCQVTRIDIHEVTCYSYVALYFERLLHPSRLAELYGTLPGVIHSDASRLDGDWPNLYPRMMHSAITYLFRYAWGDCMAGCIYNEYWYFIFEGDQPVFVGHWAPDEDPNEPDWWEEARQNEEAYRRW